MYRYLVYFLTFSFLGWCAEMLYHKFKTGRTVNRGLCKGPICPIYGIGVCLCGFLLSGIESFFLLSLLSMALATAVELSAGAFIAKTTGQRLWDYSAERGNVLGFICPKFSLIWGILCAIAVKTLPRLDSFAERIETPVGYICVSVFLLITLLDAQKGITKRMATVNEKKVK